MSRSYSHALAAEQKFKASLGETTSSSSLPKNNIKEPYVKSQIDTNIYEDASLLMKEWMLDIKKHRSLTALEQRITTRFFTEVESGKPISNVKNENIKKEQKSKYIKKTTIEKKQCKSKENCIIWNCIFLHPDTRKSECLCTETSCEKLHQYQAICKNSHHKSDCPMAHSIKELYERTQNN